MRTDVIFMDMPTLETHLKPLPKDLAQLILAFSQISMDMQSQFPKYLSGASGDRNKYGEAVAKLDKWANGHLCDSLIQTGLVRTIHSEELGEPIYHNDTSPFVVTLDPLDGSSNIVTNNSFGIIMGIYRDDLPKTGRKLTAAVYKLYGPVNTLVYSAGMGVHEFVKHYYSDGSAEFLLLNENMKLPKKGEVFGIGADPLSWNPRLMTYAKDLFRHEKMKVRYCGSFVGDFSQVLHKGGFFSYPSTSKDPDGKFRLYYECIPLGFLCEEAGGATWDGSASGNSVLDRIDNDVDARTPLYLGNKELIEKLKKAMKA
ncbi:Fructose-1,6-bisphosphatase class 1 [uncultured archaeon]|nr:Fructose-1,6-bisphosphatase class 1 [uncultured archaeon]